MERRIFTRGLIVFILTFYLSNVNGQNNLLKNGNFEVTNTSFSCHYNYLFSPNFYVIPGPIQFLYSPNSYTPDYFNSCVTDTTGNNYAGLWVVGVPKNRRGFQYAKSGNGYVGILNWYNLNNGKDYVSIALKETLKTVGKYYFEVWCNQSAWHGYFSNDIAAFFHDTLINENSVNTLEQFNPQIVNNGNIIDTLNWCKFSGIYKAHGGENYITIGNFKNYLNNPDTLKNPWWNLSPDWVLNDVNEWENGNYIFIDDAWLIELPEISVQDSVKICLGDSIELMPDTIGLWQGIHAHWEPSAGLNNPNIFSPLAFPTQTTTYYLTLQDTGRFANALAGIIDSVTVIVNTELKNITLSNDTSVCKGDTLLLNANCTGCEFLSFHWSPESAFLDASQNPALLVASGNTEVSLTINSLAEKICLTGNHPISITLGNEEDCIDNDAGKLLIPNTIAVGKNWTLTGITNPEVSLWDARGRLIFYSKEYMNDFSVNEAQGLYFYRLLFKGSVYEGKLLISP